jgi:two-component system CheB/CheR fusion protein
MEQVIINLISNAVKYSPGQEKVTITVSSHNREIKIAITDFGIGIPKDKLPFLFDRFYRVDDTSQRYSGLGLGLYISAEIVRRHDGVIGIESRPGEGSTFWFTIPEAS